MTHKGTYDRFFALLARLPHPDKDELKTQLVWQFSGMLTESLKEFCDKNPEGYKRMLAHLQVEVEKLNPARFAREETKRLRSSILIRLQKFGVDTTDWGAVNKFLESNKIAGKRLYNLTNDEMSALIPKLESILKKSAEQRERERELAQNN